MKKYLALLLAAVMALSLVACGSKTDDTNTGDGDDTAVSYPTKTIEIICPFSTGGDTDALARALANEMTKELGVSVMVTNMTGGGGSVASTYVKDAQPDGYTVYWCHNTLVVNDICDISDYNHDAFEPAALCAQSSALCVWTNSQFSSLDEMVSYAKEHPGELNVGMVQGGITEIMAIAFCKAVGIEVNYVDCGSGNDMNVEMVAGRVAMCVNTFGTVSEYYNSGDLQPLAVMGKERLGKCPDVPTMEELGYDVVGDMYYGFYFPKGTDESVIDAFNAAAKVAAQSDSYLETLESYGYNPVFIEKDDAKATMDNILEYYTQFKDLMA